MELREQQRPGPRWLEPLLFRVPLDCEGMVGIGSGGRCWGMVGHMVRLSSGAVQAHWGLGAQQEVRSQLREGNASPRPQEEIDPNTLG